LFHFLQLPISAFVSFLSFTPWQPVLGESPGLKPFQRLLEANRIRLPLTFWIPLAAEKPLKGFDYSKAHNLAKETVKERMSATD